MKVFSFYRKKMLLYIVTTSMLFLFSLSCKDEPESSPGNPHDPSKPILVTTFFPTKGGAKDKILLDGENFGTDASNIEVYFNLKKAAVISSSGNRIYAIVPRLPGDNPTIKVVVGENSATYDSTFLYTPQAQVTTVTGNGTRNFLEGTLDQAHVYGKYLELDAEGNLFMSWRDGGSWGVARISEKENIVTALIEAKTTDERVLYANGLTVDRATGILTASHESVPEVFFSFDPREAWNPRQRNAKFSESDYSSIVWSDRYANFITYCPYDKMLYTRFRDGKIARIDPDTYEAKIVHQGPYGSQYGQGINPLRPWELYITLHSNANPVEFRQGIMMLDLRDPDSGFKRLNAPGGSGFRDGPVEDALFNYPKDIKFDNDGNMFIADYNNHCIRMLSADGIVSTVAGQPGTSGYKDGGPVVSLFKNPWGVAVNELGEIYIADWGNARIRKLVIE
ncbi:IPT/TIG domain-containing protein [Mariniphaga anaerophila]|nr:IPT/TIG domain-containing protein [Mariniphaga anaerophila]